MKNSRHPVPSEDEEQGRDIQENLHHHHLKAIIVMLGFTVAQFFFMGYVVQAGELTIKALLECTNNIRLLYEPNGLLMNTKLAAAAEDKLQDMTQYKYWAHQNPVTGRQPWDFVDDAGYYYETTGENLAYGFTDSKQVCNAWEKSPKHLENIKDSTYQEVGFAVDKANLRNEKGMLVVQMFGSREDFKANITADSIQRTSTGSTQEAQPVPSSGRQEVRGAAERNPVENGEDSLHPQESFLKKALPYAIGAAAFLSALLAALDVFVFRKDRKKARLCKDATIVMVFVTIILLLLSFSRTL